MFGSVAPQTHRQSGLALRAPRNDDGEILGCQKAPLESGEGRKPNRSSVLTLIRRCETTAFSVKTLLGHAPAPGRQRAVNGFAAGFAHSLKGSGNADSQRND